MNRLLLLVPTGGTALLRASQLATLFALSTLTAGTQQGFLITGFGLMASFTIITDSGAANYLLSLRPQWHSRSIYRSVLILQAVLGLCGGVALFVFLLVIAPAGTPLLSYLVLVALAVSQLTDSLTRVAKAPWLVWRRDGVYGTPDALTGVAKIVLVGAAVLSQELSVLLFMPVISLAACVVVVTLVRRRLNTEVPRPDRVIRNVLEIGVTGSLSAFYSQTPMFVAAAVLPIETAAVMAVLYRVTQALELVPASASAQFIPRIDRSHGPLRLWGIFTLGGVLMATVLAFAWPAIAKILDVDIPLMLALAVTAGFALKCGNYALVAYLLGTGRIRERLIVTITTGVLAVALVIAAALLFGVVGLAVTSPIIEVVFLVVTIVVLRVRDERRAAVS